MSNSPPITLLEELGRGATAVVWRAALTEPTDGLAEGAEVACKRFYDSPEARACHAREAQVGGAVRAEGLMRHYAGGEDDEGPWILMELIPGRNLAEVLAEEHALAEPLVRSIGRQLFGALAALHREGISHGDLKPENARLDQSGRSVLVDLGFAGAGDPGGEDARGTPLYLAPEQTQGAPLSPAADVFSLGVVLYELLTGAHPLVPAGGKDTAEIFRAIEAGGAEPASSRVPTVSTFLDHLLAATLNGDPSQRPTAQELCRRLTEGEAGTWWREESDRGEWGAGSRAEDIPLVSRGDELQTLQACWRELGPSQGGVVILEGPAGSGKSRLVRAFADVVRLSDTPPLALITESITAEETRPCRPFLRMLRRTLRLPPGAKQGAREREELGQALSPSSTETLLQALDPEFEGLTSSSVPFALSEWISALASERGVIVFLDDIHLADEGSLTVAHRVVESLDESQVLLVLGLDSTRKPRRAGALARLLARARGHAPSRTLTLDPLDPDGVLDVVRQLFAPSAPRLRLSRVLWERSRGNPGFLAELLRGLERRGSITRSGPSEPYELLVNPDEIPLPDSLATAITESHRELEPYDRRWLQRLSVCGGRITESFLSNTWPEASGPELPEMLSRLTHAGWLTPAGDRLRFARPALREAVYRSLKEDKRRELHRAVARSLSAPTEAPASLSSAFQLAWHLRASGAWEELLERLPALLERLSRMGQPGRVRSLCDWGLEALSMQHADAAPERRRLQLLELRADAADLLGDRTRQRADLDDLSLVAGDPDADPGAAGRIYLLHARHAAATRSHGMAPGLLRNAIEFLKRTELSGPLSDARRRLAEVHAQTGELDLARGAAKRALIDAPDDKHRGLAQIILGSLDVLEDLPESALRRADRAVRLFRRTPELDTTAGLGAANLLRARAYRSAGRPRRALASSQRAVRQARRAADRSLEAESLARLGASHLDLDAPEEAELRLRDAVLLSEEIEFNRGLVIALLHLGILAAEAARPDAAELLDRATHRAREAGHHRLEAIGLSIRARVDHIAGDPERAAQGLERALWLLERYGAELVDRIVIIATQAMVLEALEQPERARAAVKDLRKTMRQANEEIEGAVLKRRQRLGTTRLLESALTDLGPVFPRSGDISPPRRSD